MSSRPDCPGWVVLTTAAIPGTLPAGDRRTFAAAPPSGDRVASACLASGTGERWLKEERGKKNVDGFVASFSRFRIGLWNEKIVK